MEEGVGKLWGDSDKGEFGPVGLYGLSVGLQWLRLVSFLLVQRELGQVNCGREPSQEAGYLDSVYIPIAFSHLLPFCHLLMHPHCPCASTSSFSLPGVSMISLPHSHMIQH
jgi:hypothetical protein